MKHSITPILHRKKLEPKEAISLYSGASKQIDSLLSTYLPFLSLLPPCPRGSHFPGKEHEKELLEFGFGSCCVFGAKVKPRALNNFLNYVCV